MSTLNAGETLQPFKPLRNNLIFDSSGNLVGIQNDRANGTDLRLNGGSAGTFSSLVVQAAGTLDLYNTADQTTNYERLAFAWGSNIATISTDAAGTGTVRWLRLNGATLSLMSGGTQRWNVNGSGHFLAEVDNTYDIGASGASRPRNVYVADTVYSNATRLTQIVAVGSLPAAAASPYTRRLVNDSTVAMAGNYGAIVAGGGANTVPVFSDGTNWRIG